MFYENRGSCFTPFGGNRNCALPNFLEMQLLFWRETVLENAAYCLSVSQAADKTRLLFAVGSLFSALLFCHCKKTQMVSSPQNKAHKLLHCQDGDAIARQNHVSPEAIFH